MRTRYFQLLIVLAGFFNAVQHVKGCELPQTFDKAFADSEAIFLGRVVEERQIPMATRGGSGLSYKEVKFEVIESWRLVDRATVWIRVPSVIAGSCGYNSTATNYLVYANQLNDILYISPLSRTMRSDLADMDIERLGAGTIHIRSGEYSPFMNSLITIGFFLVGLLSVCIWLLMVYRRSTNRS